MFYFPLFLFVCFFGVCFLFSWALQRTSLFCQVETKRSESGRWLQQTPNSEGGRTALTLVWALAWLWASLSRKRLRFLLSHISGRWLKQRFKHMRASMNHTSSLLLHRCHFDLRIITHQSSPGRKRGLTSQRPDSESWLCYCLTKSKSFLRVSISWSVKHVSLTDYNSLRGSTEFNFFLSPSLCLIFYIKWI